ncbi:MAG: hypothetical protein KAU50_04855 [Candidatus Marinimicrobia bacterium]|nr:hypothetical protein [Candidatus Neomarinimicrobiota bacterium]
MKRFIIYSGLSLFTLLGLFIFSAGSHAVELAWRLHPLLGAILALLVTVLLCAVTIYPMGVVIAALRRTRHSWVAGSPGHNRFLARLKRQHLKYRVTDLDNFDTKSPLFLNELYMQLYEKSNVVMLAAAERIFYHTAISQAGQLDSLVSLTNQVKLINAIATLYYPKARLRIFPSLYADVIEASLVPSSRDDINLGAQIGPAVVGASVVGAIPGANLVALLISDAIVQGSANSLATLRAGLLARRYFHRSIEGKPSDLETERKAVTQEALDMLSPLINDASTIISRIIWNAAKDHIRRVPTATYEGLKSIVSKSVRGISGRGGVAASQEPAGTEADS